MEKRDKGISSRKKGKKNSENCVCVCGGERERGREKEKSPKN